MNPINTNVHVNNIYKNNKKNKKKEYNLITSQ